MMRRRLALVILLAAWPAASCGERTGQEPVDGRPRAMQEHLRNFTLDDSPIDDPGSPGELRAIQYAQRYMQSLGLATTLQSVPLVQMIPTSAHVQVSSAGGTFALSDSSNANFIIWAGRQQENVEVEGSLVFAGYGIVSPEYHRDDYKDADVAGKIVLVLEGAPATGDSNELGTLGEIYYGTRLYKYAEAARHGAAGVLIIQGADGDPWSYLQEISTGAIVEIDGRVMDRDEQPKTAVEGWLSADAAGRLFRAAGMDYAELTADARELSFLPSDVSDFTVTLQITSRTMRYTSYDLLAVLPGERPEYVMLGGRWNRLDPDAWSQTFASSPPASEAEGSAGDPYAGDNGSGAVAVMEAARMLVQDHPRPRRTVVFMIATALKPGVLGLEYYMEHPLPGFPIDNLNALIFMDHADMDGSSDRVGKIGTASDIALSQIARGAAMEQGRLYELDESEEKRFYYKFSETTLALDGVRALYLTTRPEEDGSGRVLRKVEQRDDVVGLVSTVDDLRPPNPSEDPALLATITLRVANATNWPPRHVPQPARR